MDQDTNTRTRNKLNKVAQQANIKVAKRSLFQSIENISTAIDRLERISSVESFMTSKKLLKHKKQLSKINNNLKNIEL